MNRLGVKRSKRKKKVEPLLSIIAAALVGCALIFLCGLWIVSGRVEYWTGSTERHHFVAPVDSVPLWVLVLVLIAEAVVLWVNSVRAFSLWWRFR